jgi:hypothetical protein
LNPTTILQLDVHNNDDKDTPAPPADVTANPEDATLPVPLLNDPPPKPPEDWEPKLEEPLPKDG